MTFMATLIILFPLFNNFYISFFYLFLSLCQFFPPLPSLFITKFILFLSPETLPQDNTFTSLAQLSGLCWSQHLSLQALSKVLSRIMPAHLFWTQSERHAIFTPNFT